MSLFAETALLVMAAGRGSRFGRDKLSEPLHDRALAIHIIATVAPLDFAEKVVVTQGQQWGDAFAAEGFAVVLNPAPQRGLSSSLRLAVAASSMPNVLVLLADMPFVSARHLENLGRAYFAANGAPQMSAGANHRGPPAMMHRSLLLALPGEGDEGARSILATAAEVFAGPGELNDIDRLDDLAQAHAQHMAGS